MEYITDRAAIKAGIKAINTARGKLVDRIQIVGLSAIRHAHLHGDYDLLNELRVAVGNGMKATALKLWVLDYAPVSWDSEAKAFRYSKAKRVEGEELDKTMTAASLKPWYDYQTEKKVEEFTDVYAGIAALLRKLEKKPAKEGQEAAVKALRELAAKVEA